MKNLDVYARNVNTTQIFTQQVRVKGMRASRTLLFTTFTYLSVLFDENDYMRSLIMFKTLFHNEHGNPSKRAVGEKLIK
ncbi:4046_t:CDS:2, partial [Acaulospora morrowiae]